MAPVRAALLYLCCCHPYFAVASDSADHIGSSPKTFLSNWGDFPEYLYEDQEVEVESVGLRGTKNREYSCVPKHLHLSQASNANPINNEDYTISMTLSFALDFEGCHPTSVKPVVEYGINGSENEIHKKVITTAPFQFNYTSRHTLEDGFHSDWIYHVELTDLKVGLEEYWYRIQIYSAEKAKDESWIHNMLTKNVNAFLSFSSSTSHQTASREDQLVGSRDRHLFSTPPLPGNPTALAVVGDLGQSDISRRIMAHIWKHSSPDRKRGSRVSNLIIPGDMSYASAHPESWPTWFQIAEPLLRQVALSIAVGNHEIECDTKTLDVFVPYENYFRVPNRVQDSDMIPITQDYVNTLHHKACQSTSKFRSQYNYGNAFYSYTHGLVHVIVLNSYTFSDKLSPQYKWLKKELKTVDRGATPWLVVVCHIPLYTTYAKHYGESADIKRTIEPLLIQHQVNMVLSGHDHGYQRTHPVAYGKVTPGAPLHFILGAGGSPEGLSRRYVNPSHPEKWVAQRDHNFPGYGLFEFANATHAHFKFVTDRATSRDVRGFQDQLWIENSYHEGDH